MSTSRRLQVSICVAMVMDLGCGFPRKHLGCCGSIIGGESVAVTIAILLTFGWLYTDHWLLLDGM